MQRIKTWKRLTTIGATTAVIAGMSPFVGVVAAHADVTGHVQLIDPLNLTTVTASNGGDNLQHLYADVQQATGVDPQVQYVRFDVKDTTTNGPLTTIATAPVNAKAAGPDSDNIGGSGNGDAFATATWSVPATTDTYQVTATALEGNQSTPVGTASTNSVTATGSGNGVTLTRPLNNSPVGYYDYTGDVNVTGTTPATATPVTAYDTPDGTVAGEGGPATGIYNGQSDTWAADVDISGETAPGPGTNTSLTGIRASTANGNEDAAGTAYLQAFAASPNGFTISPASGFGCQTPAGHPPFGTPPTTADCSNGTSTNPFQVYTLQATDQHGNPISGMPVDLTFTDPNNNGSATVEFRSTSGPTVWTADTFTSGTAVDAPTSGDYGTSGGQLTTNVFGQITFRVSNHDAEVIGINAKSKFSGSFVSGTDYNLSGSYSTTAQVPTSGTATIVGHPTAPIYATQSYGVGTADVGPTPGIAVNVKDGSNNNVQGATVQYSYVRHVTDGQNQVTCSDPNTYPVSVPTDPSSTALNSNPSNAGGNIFITPDSVAGGHTPYLQSTTNCDTTESGNDVFTVYIDKNGTPGYQAGGDTLLGTLTLPFGPESIYFKPCDQVSAYQGGHVPFAGTALQNCKDQAKAGSDLTLTVFASIWDGTTRQPVANRKIDITLPTMGGMVFSSTGNSGLVLVNPQEGDITTGSDGTATVTVTDPNPVGVLQVTASDPSLGGGVTSDDATDKINWRSFDTTLNSVDTTGALPRGELTPLDNSSMLVGAPGQPLIEGFQLDDQNGEPIANQAFTIHTTAGFLTDTPDGPGDFVYSLLHFDGADATPADGAQVHGDLHSNGSSETVVTDGSGRAFFALGIGADPAGFAQNGMVLGDVTAQLGTAGSTLTLPDNNGETSSERGLPHQVIFTTDSNIQYDIPNCPDDSCDAYGSVAALNPAASNALTLNEGLFDNNGRYHVTSSKPSGDKATTSTNTIPVDTVDVTSGQFDSFGNLVSEPIETSTSGANGSDVPSTYYGAYTEVNNATASSLGFYPDDDFCQNNAAAQSNGACPEIADPNFDAYVNQLSNPASNTPSTGPETLTADWNTSHTTWKTGAGGVSTNVLMAPDPTAGYTVNWYDREASGFKYLTHLTPKGAKHKAGTPITTTLLVLDSKGRPVNGLGVEFIRSGPKGQSQDTGNPFTCEGTCRNIQFTNVSGQAGFTFSTSTPGKYKVTALVTDGSGNEVGRAVSHGKLTKKHHHKKHHHHHHKHKKHHHKKKH